MNELYSEVREHLRQQHTANTQEIYGKNIADFHKYRYYGENENQDNLNNDTVFVKGKIFLFLVCVMIFSCYLYGGQDVKKGASMAWNDMNIQITRLEEEEPVVKDAMAYARKAYAEIKDFAKIYLNPGE